nr:hypothetical protein GCM10020093_116150 [Planobispora longispora]
MPPGHLPGRSRHPEPRAAQALHRQAGVRGQLLRVHRRGGPRVSRRARLPLLDEAIGHVELLDTASAEDHWKAAGLDLSPILHRPELPEGTALRRTVEQDHGLAAALDNTLIQLAEGALNEGRRVTLELPIRNVNRTVGTMLGHEVTKRYGGAGLPDNTIDIRFTGSAGNSFGAFVPKGITLRLTGDANDYLGKGLSGGRITVQPHDAAPSTATSSPATSPCTAPPPARCSSAASWASASASATPAPPPSSRASATTAAST